MSWKNKMGFWQWLFGRRNKEERMLIPVNETVTTTITTQELTSDYWNNKYPKAKGIYRARDNCKYDIRSFIWEDDRVLIETIARNNLDRVAFDIPSTDDKIVYWCFEFVKDNIKYKSDKKTPYPEEWKFPVETLHDRYGDCEDSAILLASLCLNCGVPSYRLKVAIGWANSGKGTKKFYHAYMIYLREVDNQWVTMDTNSADVNDWKVFERALAKNNLYYDNPDKTFNNEFVWAQKDFEVKK